MQKPPRKVAGRGRGKVDETEPMSVFCRIRPRSDGSIDEVPWLSVLSSRVLSVTSPEPSAGRTKTSHYTFRHIFGENSTQKDIFSKIAQPLVENVLQGKNSLLFAYGITGSGKTYTMNGSSKDGGLMPRCLDVIFNSIVDCHAPKYVFKPDRLNGFDIQSDVDAEIERRNDLVNLISTVKSSRHKLVKKDSDPDLAQRLVDPTRVECIDEENLYSVFVTLTEIYNNSVFDLLEDYLEDCIRPKPLQTKIIREDSSHNMYIHGVTEVEVSSTEEAFEVFSRGQKRRRVAHTALNAESSRSHTIFNIRVVQGPIEKRGSNSSKDSIGVGQLSLVDLAGSERTTRTNNTGMRLREAGNINNSLMTLRTCLELLRENQAGANKVVPYRDSRLTHLFKTFFEGEGQVSMIVCLNPNLDNYEESLHVLKFAEMSQDVQITAATPLKAPGSYAPGRRKANNAFNNALKRLNSDSQDSGTSGDDVPPPSKVKISKDLMPFDFPILNQQGESVYPKEVLSFLQVRKDYYSKEIDKRRDKVSNFRSELVKNLKDGYLSVEELKLTKSMLAREKAKCQEMEDKTSSLEVEVGMLKRKLEESEKENKKTKLELSEKEKIIFKKNAEKDRVKEKFMTRTHEYQERIKGQFEDRLRRQKTEMELEIRNKEKKLREVQRVLSDDVLSTPSVATTRSRFETPSNYVPTPRPLTADRSRKPCSVAVANRRHRRSRSAGDTWLEHKPQAPVPLNTVMQPQMKKRKSVSKLTDAKDVTSGPSKYCLMTQNQDSDGDLETRLYKGDVIPTCGGGAQVMFNDVEILRQVSPSSSPVRQPEQVVRDPSTPCAVAIEGHRHRLRSRKY